MVDVKKIEKVELELSTLCNARCKLCTRELEQFPKKFKTIYIRPLDEIEKQISTFTNLKTVQLIGQMSEPTLYPNFIDLVEFLKSRKLRLEIYTNGSTNNKTFWDKLANILDDNDLVQFTICGKNQSQHGKYRINTDLQTILDSAKAIRDKHRIDRLTFIKFKYNKNDVYSKEFQMIKDQFSDFELINTNVKTYLEEFKQENDKEFYRIDLFSSILMKTNDKIQCRSIDEKFIYIDIYGNMYPCCIFFDYFMNEEFFDWNYDDIISKKYACCKYCQSKIIEKLDNGDFDGI